MSADQNFTYLFAFAPLIILVTLIIISVQLMSQILGYFPLIVVVYMCEPRCATILTRTWSTA